MAWGMEPIWKLSGPTPPDRMMAGKATEPVSTVLTLLDCCWRKVDLAAVGAALGHLDVSAEDNLKTRIRWEVHLSRENGRWPSRENYERGLHRSEKLAPRRAWLTFWATQNLPASWIPHLLPSQNGPCSFSATGDTGGGVKTLDRRWSDGGFALHRSTAPLTRTRGHGTQTSPRGRHLQLPRRK